VRLAILLVFVAACRGAARSPSEVGVTPPAIELTTTGGKRVALAHYTGANDQTIVVFYRGFWCETCIHWLRALATHADEYKQRRIGLVAIAADEIADMAELQKRVPEVTLLADVKLSGSVAWGLVPAGAEESTAATFVIERDGSVRYRRLAAPTSDYPTYAELAAALR